MFEYATVFLYCCRPFLRQGCKFVWLAVRIVCQYHSLLTILITAIQLFNSGQNTASYIGTTSGIYTSLRPMRNFLLSVRQIFQFQLWPHRRYCHVILGLQLLRNDVLSIFRNCCHGRSILLPVSYLLMSLPSEGQNLSTNQISSTSVVIIYKFVAEI